MPAKEETPPRPLSQSSVASFVFGTLHLTMMTVIFATIKLIGVALASVTGTLGNKGDSFISSVNREITFLEIIALLFLNVLPLLGIITGLSGLFSARKGYAGETLALMGLMFSLLAIVISIFFALAGNIEPILQILK